MKWLSDEEVEERREVDECIICHEPLPIDNLAPEGSEMCEECFDQELATHQSSRLEVSIDLDDDYLITVDSAGTGYVVVIDQVDPVVRLHFEKTSHLFRFLSCIRSRFMQS